MAATLIPRSVVFDTKPHTRLRQVVLSDGVGTAFVGAVLLTAPSGPTGLVATSSTPPISLLGALLLGLGVGVAWASRVRVTWLPYVAYGAAALALAGAILLVVAMIANAFTAAGTVVAVAVTALLLGLAEVEALLGRRLQRRQSI